MRNLNLILLFVLIIKAQSFFAQDGVFKFKKVEISFAKINQKDSLLSLELYQNALFATKETGIMGNRFSSNFDSITNTYTLYYSYTGIGGGEDNRMSCPVLFAKLNFITKDNIEYFRLIPISLPFCVNSQISSIKVVNIDLNAVVEQPDKMVLINDNEKYEIVPKEVIKMDELYKIE